MKSCKEISALLSESMDRQLTWQERGGMRMHLFMCSKCQRFEQQMQFLRKATKKSIEIKRL
ncbi:MAG: zf-HC2 domain-containing protein [Methylococcaceae bacterium]|nr:zf-HC2 domain-containing protein [Methylococcaceae bacterium]